MLARKGDFYPIMCPFGCKCYVCVVIFGHLLLTARIARGMAGGSPFTLAPAEGGGPRGLQHPERFCTWWEGADSLIWVSWHLKKHKCRLELTILVCKSVCGWRPAADPAGLWQALPGCWGSLCLSVAGGVCRNAFTWCLTYRVMDHTQEQNQGTLPGWERKRNETRVHYLAEKGEV